MRYFDWSEEKNVQLKRTRGISFEAVLVAIEGGRLLAVMDHPNNEQYPNQAIIIIKVSDYAYLVPFVEDDEKIFLKTIIPSRKATKKYIIK